MSHLHTYKERVVLMRLELRKETPLHFSLEHLA